MVAKKYTRDVITERRNVVNALKNLEFEHREVTAEMLSAYLEQFYKDSVNYTTRRLSQILTVLRKKGAIWTDYSTDYSTDPPSKKYYYHVLDEDYKDEVLANLKVDLPVGLYNALKIRAKRMEVTVQKLVRDLIQQEVDKEITNV